MQYGLVDLPVLLRVISDRGVSRGARRCNLANSSVSQRTASRGSEFETALLQRRARNATRTPVGQVLKADASQCLASLEQMRVDVAPFANNAESDVIIFADSKSLASQRPAARRFFLFTYSSVRVVVQKAMRGDFVSVVANGRSDLEIAAGEIQPPELYFLQYGEDELVLLFQVRHALSKTSTEGFIKALDEPYVSLHSGSTIHTSIKDRGSDLNYLRDMQVQVIDYAAVITSASEGGVSVVPRSALSFCDEEITIKPSESGSRRDMYICKPLLKNTETRLCAPFLNIYKRPRWVMFIHLSAMD